MPMQAQRGDGTVAPNHSQHSKKSKWVISATLRPPCPGKDTIPLVKGVGRASGLVYLQRDSIPETSSQ
jgi:hypothetical protein